MSLVLCAERGERDKVGSPSEIIQNWRWDAACCVQANITLTTVLQLGNRFPVPSLLLSAVTDTRGPCIPFARLSLVCNFVAMPDPPTGTFFPLPLFGSCRSEQKLPFGRD